MRLGVLHGPNLNLLGRREPETYGSMTLAEVDAAVGEEAATLGVEVESFQSNHEGELIDRIQHTAKTVAGFVLNAGGYTHTSVAIRDALVGVDRPFVEVHMSNVHAREDFRQKSLLAPMALGTVQGFGADSYRLALRGLVRHLQHSKRE